MSAQSASRVAAPPMTVTVSNDTTPAEWNAYVAAHPESTHCHLWNWRRVFDRVFGQRSEYLVARTDRVTGVLPLVTFKSQLFGRCVISLPFLNDGGVLADDEQTATALLDEARRIAIQFDGRHIELRHRRRQHPMLPSRDHKVGMLLALDTPVALWDALDRKVRNQVRKAQKSDVSVVSGGAELADDFYAVFADNMRDLGTPVYPKTLFTETLAAFPDSTRLFIARHEGTPIACAFACVHAGTFVVPWASSLRAYRNLCGNMLMYWTMIETAANERCHTFDFGRSTPDGGTFQFKQQWGAVARPLHWEYVLLKSASVPDQGPTNPKFKAAIEAWKRLPLWVTTCLGPAIVRNIP